jgi:GTP cyclohydrolase II
MPDKYAPLLDIPDRAAAPDGANAAARAIDELRRGGVVAVSDGERRLLVAPAETLTASSLSTLRRRARAGAILATSGARASAIGIATDESRPVACPLSAEVALEAIVDVTIGGEASDALIARAIPVIGEETGMLVAALSLTKLAGLVPAVVAGRDSLRGDAIPTTSVDDVTEFAARSARWLTQVAAARVPLADCENAQLIVFRPWGGGPEHIAIVIGTPDIAAPVLVRIHSSCFTGDLLGSLRCDCGDQLRGALAAIAKTGAGIVVYLPQEGRGIGLVNKLRAYALQDLGLDTIDANRHLGFAPDERDYAAAGEILRRLGVVRIRLLTNNPGKREALATLGLEITERVPLAFPANPHNEAYLRTKAVRDGHKF